MIQIFQRYKIPLFEAALSISLLFLLILLRIPIFFLQGLHSYIQPENVGQPNGGGGGGGGSGFRAAIRRPSSSSDSAPGPEEKLRRRGKSKEKFEFDESKAQIFRLRLDEGHLRTRLYFDDYWYSFILSFLALSSFLLCKYFDGDGNAGVDDNGFWANGSLIPVVLGFCSLCRVIVSLSRVSFEKSASKRSEKQFSLLVGVLSFVFGLVICSGIGHSVLDFDVEEIDGFGRVFVAVLMGCLAGFLYMPAGKNARSFWVGTDQVRSNLDIISGGWFARMILYASYLLVLFTAMLWINPLAAFLVNKNIDHGRGTHLNNSIIGDAEKLVGNVGFTQSDFTKLRFLCLLLSGLIQIMALRPNLQMYLNEAVLCWYQRLHASKVPDLDFSRAKVFLHNHYLCLVVLQFFAPPTLVLLFVGLSQMDGKSFKTFQFVCSLVPCTAFSQEVFLFMAWWVVFVWSVITSLSLLFYRRGILYVS